MGLSVLVIEGDVTVAKFLSEVFSQQGWNVHVYLTSRPSALVAWIYLDDFRHWFEGKLPDLLFVALLPEANGGLPLYIEALETKCKRIAGRTARSTVIMFQSAINRVFNSKVCGGFSHHSGICNVSIRYQSRLQFKEKRA